VKSILMCSSWVVLKNCSSLLILYEVPPGPGATRKSIVTACGFWEFYVVDTVMLHRNMLVILRLERWLFVDCAQPCMAFNR
jgi:hypothetical protein